MELTVLKPHQELNPQARFFSQNTVVEIINYEIYYAEIVVRTEIGIKAIFLLAV